jgi:hypothetical protein
VLRYDSRALQALTGRGVSLGDGLFTILSCGEIHMY